MIIDRKSCENIICKYTIDKLRLLLEPYPKPYKTRWIKLVWVIMVTQDYKVPFSIGKCRDEIYYDMVDMDSYSLIFGRLWQYSVDVRYLDTNNLYKLNKDYVNSTLVTLKEECKPKASKVKGKVFFTIENSKHEIQSNVKDIKQIYALVIKVLVDGGVKGEHVDISNAIKHLLIDFKEILPDKLCD